MEVVNHNPTFGSSLLNDNFGLRDDLEADLDPLQLEPLPSTTTTTTTTTTEGSSRVQDSTKDSRGEELGPSQLDYSLLLQNPNGATQMFTDMHGISAALKEGESLERPGGRTGMRHMAHVTAGEQQGSGVTDWGAGTDGGRSGKPQVGVPYGSFAGV